MQSRLIRSLITLLLAVLLTSALFTPAAFADADLSQTPAERESAGQTPADGPLSNGKKVSEITIKTSGKNTYLEGEKFDPSGYTLHVKYDDNTEEDVGSDKFTYAPAERLTVSGSSNDITVDLSYAGMSKKTVVTVVRATKLELVSKPTKLVYKEGEKFDPTGLKLKIGYSNGKERIAEADEYASSLPENITSSVTSINITCYGQSVKLDGIKVAKIESLEITKFPDKIEYYEGDKFDPSGMIVSAKYEGSSDSVLLEDGDYTIEGPLDSLAPDSDDRLTLLLTVKVGSVSQKFPVKVHGFESFKITSMPTKADYYYGDTFVKNGLKVEAKFVGADKLVDITDRVTIIAPDVMKAGSEVRIKYLDYEASLLTVHEITKILIKTPPKSVTFKEGTKLTEGNALSEMLVVAEYDDGHQVPLAENDYTIEPSHPLTVSDNKLTVTYTGLSASIDIKVEPANAIKEIKITKAPELTSYISNQPVDVTGMEVTVYYVDGTSEVVPLDRLKITPAPGTPVKVTDTRIKVVYELSESLVYSDSQTIEVSPKRVVSLSILTPPKKLVYVEGEKFSTEGMEVLAVYNDGTSAKITSYTCFPSGAFTLSSDVPEELVNVTITYVNCIATQTVRVKEREIKSVEVAQNPTRLEYAPGEKFDMAGLILKITYADGTTALVENLNGITCTPSGALTTDTKEVTLTFRRKTLTVPITVREGYKPPVTGEVTTAPIDPDSSTNAPVTGDPATETTGGTEPSPSGKKFDAIMVVWIIIIIVIVALLVVLIIYYKRNFT